MTYPQQPGPYQQPGHVQPFPPQPPRRRSGARHLLWILPVVGLMVLTAIGVGLYATGVIGPSAGGPASAYEPADPDEHRYTLDEGLCDKLNLSAFELLAEPSSKLLTPAARDGWVSCSRSFADVPTNGQGSFDITVNYHPNSAAAADAYNATKVYADEVLDVPGDWAKARGGSQVDGRSLQVTLQFIDSNVDVEVGWLWDGEGDAKKAEAAVLVAAQEIHRNLS